MWRNLILLAAAALGLLGVIGGGFLGYWQFTDYLARPGPTVAATKVVLPRGVGLTGIVARLHGSGVIEHPWLFQLAVQLSGQDRSLKAGEYQFPARASPHQVIAMLARGETVRRRLTVAEGLTVAEIYRLIGDVEGLTGRLPALVPEGSLLPETYLYSYGDTRADMVARMQAAQQHLLAELWANRAEGLPFTDATEALTLASIVDKETGQSDEREVVAAVFLNRLRAGMKLQSDPTIIYGLTSGQGPLGRALTRADWQHDHPYNTYRIDGLPPTPIGNPGRASIEAVLNPAKVNYLYFVADGTGGHAFATTLDEHNRNVARWRKVRDRAAALDGRSSGNGAAGSEVTPFEADAPAKDRSTPAAAPPPHAPQGTKSTGTGSWTAPLPNRPE